MGLFTSCAGEFQEICLPLYGKDTEARYYSTGLLWGQKLYQKLRFVLVEYDGIQGILASTSLLLGPVEIIKLYSFRFRVEGTFRELKQQAGAFCYHFWSKHMPKRNHFRKKGAPDILEDVESRSIMYPKIIFGNFMWHWKVRREFSKYENGKALAARRVYDGKEFKNVFA